MKTTFRPWDGTAQALEERLLLVCAVMTLADGRAFPGACLVGGPPSQLRLPVCSETEDVLLSHHVRPRIFVNAGRGIPFWGDWPDGVANSDRKLLRDAGGNSEVFPIKFDARSEDLPDAPQGFVAGFYRTASWAEEDVVVETGFDKPSLVVQFSASGTSYEPLDQLIRQAKASPDVRLVEQAMAEHPDEHAWDEIKRIADEMIDGIQESVLRRLIFATSFDEALERLDVLINAKPQYGRWRLLQANALTGVGDLRGALEAQKKLVDVSPGVNVWHMHVCSTLIDLEEYDECLEWADQGMKVRINPSLALPIDYSKQLRLFAGRALYGLGRFDEAVRCVKRLPRNFYHWWPADPLMHRTELTKACEEAMKS